MENTPPRSQQDGLNELHILCAGQVLLIFHLNIPNPYISQTDSLPRSAPV